MPAAAARKQQELFSQAFSGQVASLEREVLLRQQELESARGRVAELEQALSRWAGNIYSGKKISLCLGFGIFQRFFLKKSIDWQNVAPCRRNGVFYSGLKF